MNFTSDNSGPAAPEILEAICRANEGYSASYGADDLMELVREEFRNQFESPEVCAYLVATGTAANALGLACLCPPWSTIYCHRHSHVQEDECGAPEFFSGGAKLTLLDGEHAKVDLRSLERALADAAPVGVHNVQSGALSLSNATENGAVYTCPEIEALTGAALGCGIPSHMDGARLANAIIGQGCSPSDMTWRAGIDVLSFGGTKNGLLGVEAVLVFDTDLAWEFELRRKRGGHLLSKHRYLAAQMATYLSDGLWLTLASRANRQATRLAEGLRQVETAEIIHPVDANMVFVRLPRFLHRKAFAAGAEYYLWPHNQHLDGNGFEAVDARLVCNWSTTDDDVERLVDCLVSAS